MKIRKIILLGLLLIGVGIIVAFTINKTTGDETMSTSLEYKNPVDLQRADPSIYKHSDGYYYFTASDPEFNLIELRRSDTIQGLSDAEAITIWEKHSFGPMSANIWAPEIHYIDGKIDSNSNLYIAKMTNPWTIEGEQVLLSKPELPWEIIGYKVNEGPAVIKNEGKIFMTYSASATDINYCMGLLTAEDTSDLLDPASWTKATEPVFSTNETNGQYGPGHNSFTVSEDGKSDLLVYHARNYKEIVGDPLNDPNRHTRVQILEWNEDGTPNFGVPVMDFDSKVE